MWRRTLTTGATAQATSGKVSRCHSRAEEMGQPTKAMIRNLSNREVHSLLSYTELSGLFSFVTLATYPKPKHLQGSADREYMGSCEGAIF